MLKPKYDSEDYVEEYEEAKMNEFQVQLCKELEDMEVSEADIDWYQGFLDSFSFEDEADWCWNQYVSEIDSIDDIQYMQWEDER